MLALKHAANALLTLHTQEGDQLALPKSAQRDRLCRSGLVSEPAVAVEEGTADQNADFAQNPARRGYP